MTTLSSSHNLHWNAHCSSKLLIHKAFSHQRHGPCVLPFMARRRKIGKPPNSNLRGKRILIVEDHSLISESLIDLLRRYGHPFRASTGSDALQQIRKKTPDVILLDLSLPDMNGLELANM